MPLASFLSRHAAWVLAVGVFAGLLVPGIASLVRPLLPITVGGLLVLSIMQTRGVDFRQRLKRPAVPLAAIFLILCAMPVATWALLSLAGVPESLRTPIVLMAAAPPIMSAPAMALMLGLSAPLMLVVVVGATLAAPFTLGIVAETLVESGLRIDPFNLALRLAGFIFSCFLIALSLRAIVGAERVEKLKPSLDVIGLVLLLTFAIAIMDGISLRLEQQTGYVVAVLAITFVANLLLQVAGGLAFKSVGAPIALTVAFACGNRNMGLLLAVLPQTSAADTLLYFAVAQIPIYTLPAILSPMYNAVLKRGA